MPSLAVEPCNSRQTLVCQLKMFPLFWQEFGLCYGEYKASSVVQGFHSMNASVNDRLFFTAPFDTVSYKKEEHMQYLLYYCSLPLALKTARLNVSTKCSACLLDSGDQTGVM